VFAAGEVTGIGGVELSLLEGEIAGYVATGKREEARRLFPARRAARRFAAVLETDLRAARRTETLAATGNARVPLRRRDVAATGGLRFVARREVADALRHGAVSGARVRRGAGVSARLGSRVVATAAVSGAIGKLDFGSG